MVYFSIQGNFKPFSGKVISWSDELCGVSVPHQVVRNGRGNVLVASECRSGTWSSQKAEVGKEASFDPAKKKHQIFKANPADLQGRVVGAKTFALGRDAFFSALTIDLGDNRFQTIAFRPYPSQKRKMGLDLIRKNVVLENGELFVVDAKGGRKPWLK
jgi:hypothetical protein